MKLAFIKRPWAIDADIGRPVEILRAAHLGETIQCRNGHTSRVVGPGDSKAWLCDSSSDGFPCFIADYCLIIVDGDESHEESTEAMRRLTQLPQKEKV